MAWRGTITVDVDVSEVIGELEDEDLLEELRTRKLDTEGLGFDRDYAARALSSLLAGRTSEAVALLDRALHPYPTDQAATSLMTLFQHAKAKEN